MKMEGECKGRGRRGLRRCYALRNIDEYMFEDKVRESWNRRFPSKIAEEPRYLYRGDDAILWGFEESPQN